MATLQFGSSKLLATQGESSWSTSKLAMNSLCTAVKLSCRHSFLYEQQHQRQRRDHPEHWQKGIQSAFGDADTHGHIMPIISACARWPSAWRRLACALRAAGAWRRKAVAPLLSDGLPPPLPRPHLPSQLRRSTYLCRHVPRETWANFVASMECCCDDGQRHRSRGADTHERHRRQQTDIVHALYLGAPTGCCMLPVWQSQRKTRTNTHISRVLLGSTNRTPTAKQSMAFCPDHGNRSATGERRNKTPRNVPPHKHVRPSRLRLPT